MDEVKELDNGVVDKMLHQLNEDFDYTGLPSNLIITNVPNSVFTDSNIKREFETLFRHVRDGDTERRASTCSIPDKNQNHIKAVIYLPSFRRVRVDFDSPQTATYFRIILNQVRFHGSVMKAFYIQDPLQISTDTHLKIPPPFRNFLISPPSSPPEGWEQQPEAQPVINYDLISALAQLTPGESHEIHPESERGPKIVVHIAEEQSEDDEATNDNESGQDASSSEPEIFETNLTNPDAQIVGNAIKIKRKIKKHSKKEPGIKGISTSAIHTPRPPLKTQH